MVGKIWKKVLFFILIVACLFNIINKLVHKASLDQELESSARYIQQQQMQKKIISKFSSKKFNHILEIFSNICYDIK